MFPMMEQFHTTDAENLQSLYIKNELKVNVQRTASSFFHTL